MNRETLERMSAQELEEYGRLVGVITTPADSNDDRIRLIESKREHEVVIHALGLDLRIPKKRMSDMRVRQLVVKPDADDADAEEALRLVLGEEQMARVVEACTDEDGTIDVNGLGLVYVKVLTSDELKN